MKYQRAFNSCILSLLIFWTLFSGNALILELFPLFLTSLFLILYILALYPMRFSARLNVNNVIVISFIFLMIMFYMISMNSLNYNDYYNYWPFLCSITLLSLYSFGNAVDVGRINPRIVGFTFFIIAMVLMVGASMNVIDGRGGFLFGPNVLYRIFACACILLLIGFSDYKYKKTFTVFVLLFYISGIWVTSSRGAVLLLPIIILACLHFIYGRIKSSVIIPAIVIFGMIFVGITYNLDEQYFGRLLSFDYTQNIRITPWLYLFENFKEVIDRREFSYEFFHLNFVVLPGFQYPHNLFLEFLYYYEWVGLVFIIVFFILFTLNINSYLRTSLNYNTGFFYISTIFFIASMLSGDLSDNFPVVALVLYAYLASLRKNKPN